MHPDRVVIGADPGDEWAADGGRGALRAAGRGDRPHRRRQRRDDQARLQRLPRHQDLLRQRDRQRLRGGRRRRRARSPGAWAWTSGSARPSCEPGIGYGGSCFRKDVSALKMLAGNTGYHFQLLNAVIEVNELQKRRVVGKLREAPRLAGRQADRAARPRLQARHRRHARGVEPGARRAPAGRGRRGRSPTTRSPTERAARVAAHGRDGAPRRSRRSTAPTPRCWSPSGPSSPSWTGRRRPSAMARPLIVDGRNFLDAGTLRAGGLRVRGNRASRRRARPLRRRRLSQMQAIVLVGGEGTRLRPLTETVPKPALTLVDRPFLAYMVEWLAGHGVTEVVLACGFLPDVLREALGDGEPGGVRLALRRRAAAARHRRRDPLRRRRSSATTSTIASWRSTATSSPTST